MQVKIRSLIKSENRRETQGITIPQEVAQFFSGCYFKIGITKIGNKYGIFCESGCRYVPDEREIENYNFEECRI